MSQLDIQTDTEGRFIGLSGNFIKQTNSNGEEDRFAPDAVTITVPENMEAHVSASMTVDDWGILILLLFLEQVLRFEPLTLLLRWLAWVCGGHVRWGG